MVSDKDCAGDVSGVIAGGRNRSLGSKRLCSLDERVDRR